MRKPLIWSWFRERKSILLTLGILLVVIVIFGFGTHFCSVPQPEKPVNSPSIERCYGFGIVSTYGLMAIVVLPYFLLAGWFIEPLLRFIFVDTSSVFILYVDIVITGVILIVIYYWIIKGILFVIDKLRRKKNIKKK